jgi:NitT/TauT family transport system permease protein
LYIGLTNAFATIAVAEMLAADSGLGYLILVSRNYMATETIFVGVVTMGLLGLLTSRVFLLCAQRLARRFYM